MVASRKYWCDGESSHATWFSRTQGYHVALLFKVSYQVCPCYFTISFFRKLCFSVYGRLSAITSSLFGLFKGAIHYNFSKFRRPFLFFGHDMAPVIEMARKETKTHKEVLESFRLNLHTHRRPKRVISITKKPTHKESHCFENLKIICQSFLSRYRRESWHVMLTSPILIQSTNIGCWMQRNEIYKESNDSATAVGRMKKNTVKSSSKLTFLLLTTETQFVLTRSLQLSSESCANIRLTSFWSLFAHSSVSLAENREEAV